MCSVPHWEQSPHRMKMKPNYCPPGPRSLGQLPTRTTTNQYYTTHQDQYLYGRELSGYQGGKYTGAPGDFAPEMQKRALKIKKRAPENCHRLQCKSLFNIADLVNGI